LDFSLPAFAFLPENFCTKDFQTIFTQPKIYGGCSPITALVPWCRCSWWQVFMH